MKIAIGLKPIQGPWGGGNQFVKSFSKYLHKKKYKITYNLTNKDIDIILIIDPRKKKNQISISMLEALEYKKNINKHVKIFLRVNDCDERKNTNHVNDIFIENSKFAYKVIFVSDWLKSIYISKGIDKQKSYTIRSAANSSIFYPDFKNHKREKFKIVTHHWSANKNKGFDIYKKLDSYLSIDELKNKFEFNIIGNKPLFYNFKNSNYYKPMNDFKIAKILRNCDIYFTASKNEPAGMHFLEGLASGLPILYLDSGGNTEYCKEYGLAIDKNNILEKLFQIKSNYSFFQNKIYKYKEMDQIMLNEYLKILLT